MPGGVQHHAAGISPVVRFVCLIAIVFLVSSHVPFRLPLARSVLRPGCRYHRSREARSPTCQTQATVVGPCRLTLACCSLCITRIEFYDLCGSMDLCIRPGRALCAALTWTIELLSHSIKTLHKLEQALDFRVVLDLHLFNY